MIGSQVILLRHVFLFFRNEALPVCKPKQRAEDKPRVLSVRGRMISLLPFQKGEDGGEGFSSPQVGPTEHPIFRLLTLVLSSIEEERRRSLQGTLNTYRALACPAVIRLRLLRRDK